MRAPRLDRRAAAVIFDMDGLMLASLSLVMPTLHEVRAHLAALPA